jgi:hypothetical protein
MKLIAYENGFYNPHTDLRTSCLLDFVHRPDKIQKHKIKTFRKLVLLPSSGDGRGDTYSDGPFRLS